MFWRLETRKGRKESIYFTKSSPKTSEHLLELHQNVLPVHSTFATELA
jgi:hypothetical protein